jgi:predicted PurR-regulated permease PerM
VNFIVTVFSTIFFSILLYYVFRPGVSFAKKRGISPYITIAVLYLLTFFILAAAVKYLYPIIVEFTSEPSKKLENVTEKTMDVINLFGLHYTYADIQSFIDYDYDVIYAFLKKNLLNILGFITSLAIVIAITPFSLFYLLKDDYKFVEWFIEFIPKNYKTRVRKLLGEMDLTLSVFISGQVIVATLMSLLAFTGLLIIDINNLVILTLISFIFYTIPYLGSFLAIVPATLMGLTMGSVKGIEAAVVMTICHLIESNVVTPYVLGHRFNIHPLTIILLLIASGSVFGLLGVVFATPIYALLRVVVLNIYEAYLDEKTHILDSSPAKPENKVT